MPKRDVEGELARLASVSDAETLRKALRDRINLLAAKAAGRIGDLRLRDLAPDLLAAYDRQFPDAGQDNGAKKDPQCWAKTAIAKALKDLDWVESAPFARGAAYRQWEPVWGGEADSAGTLRANCLLAIPSCTDLLRDQKLWIVMRGLSDRTAQVRIDAARALESIAGFEAALLLRLKVRSGDSETAAIGQALESLLAVEREGAIPFAVDCIEQRGEPVRNEDLAEQAALALGASRTTEAVEALMQCAGNPKLLSMYDMLLRSLSLSRLEPAIDFLLALIEDGRERDARSALAALELHRSSGELAERVRQAVTDRGNPALTAELQRLFPSV